MTVCPRLDPERRTSLDSSPSSDAAGRRDESEPLGWAAETSAACRRRLPAREAADAAGSPSPPVNGHRGGVERRAHALFLCCSVRPFVWLSLSAARYRAADLHFCERRHSDHSNERRRGVGSITIHSCATRLLQVGDVIQLQSDVMSRCRQSRRIEGAERENSRVAMLCLRWKAEQQSPHHVFLAHDSKYIHIT